MPRSRCPLQDHYASRLEWEIFDLACSVMPEVSPFVYNPMTRRTTLLNRELHLVYSKATSSSSSRAWATGSVCRHCTILRGLWVSPASIRRAEFQQFLPAATFRALLRE